MSRSLLFFACVALVASQQVFDVSLTPNVQCHPDEAIVITLPSNGTTGRLWKLEASEGAPFEVVGESTGVYVPASSSAIGAPGRQQFTLHCLASASPRSLADFTLTRITPDGTSIEQMAVLLEVLGN